MSIVLKFGGTSLADAEMITRVVGIVDRAKTRVPLVVVSACGATTGCLIRAAKAAASGDWVTATRLAGTLATTHQMILDDLLRGLKESPSEIDQVRVEIESLVEEVILELQRRLRGIALLGELTPRILDSIACLGEQLSMRFVAGHLRLLGHETTWIDARSLILTNEEFGCASPNLDRTREQVEKNLVPFLGKGQIVVTQGFVGATHRGETTTLGRGGSDLSAALLGEALGSTEVQIWTDVEGVLSCDPRLVARAHSLSRLSFEEATELARFGATVLHPDTVVVAARARFLLTVRQTDRPDAGFTTIGSRGGGLGPVCALASRDQMTVVTARSLGDGPSVTFLARVCGVLSQLRVETALMATAEDSLCVAVESSDCTPELLAQLSEFARVSCVRERCIVSVVGGAVRSTPGLADRIFGSLEGINVEMISMGSNAVNLSVVIERVDRKRCLERLHDRLLSWRQCA